MARKQAHKHSWHTHLQHGGARPCVKQVTPEQGQQRQGRTQHLQLTAPPHSCGLLRQQPWPCRQVRHPPTHDWVLELNTLELGLEGEAHGGLRRPGDVLRSEGSDGVLELWGPDWLYATNYDSAGHTQHTGHRIFHQRRRLHTAKKRSALRRTLILTLTLPQSAHLFGKDEGEVRARATGHVQALILPEPGWAR